LGRVDVSKNDDGLDARLVCGQKLFLCRMHRRSEPRALLNISGYQPDKSQKRADATKELPDFDGRRGRELRPTEKQQANKQCEDQPSHRPCDAVASPF
jgi:hypothetical protein